MYLLGHVGIGRYLVPPKIRVRLPWRWLAVGCLLPDLLDKPLVFAAHLHWWVGPVHFDILRRTRLVGHALVFVVLLAGLSALLKSSRYWALALGSMTHVVLDAATDLACGVRPGWLLWPLLGWHLPAGWGVFAMPPRVYWIYGIAELLGAALLVGEGLRARRLKA